MSPRPSGTGTGSGCAGVLLLPEELLFNIDFMQRVPVIAACSLTGAVGRSRMHKFVLMSVLSTGRLRAMLSFPLIPMLNSSGIIKYCEYA